MDRVTAIKIKQDDGTYSAEIPISVAANNVQWDQNYNLIDILGNVNISQDGNIQYQINKKIDSTQLSNYVANQLNLDVTNWLDENVDPSTVPVIDTSLSIEGAAADAKVVGDELTNLKARLSVIGIASSTYQQPVNTAHSSDVDKVSISAKSGSVINVQVLTDVENALTGTIQYYGYYKDGTMARLGLTVNKNVTYTLTNDLVALGLYYPAGRAVESCNVTIIVKVLNTDTFYGEFNSFRSDAQADTELLQTDMDRIRSYSLPYGELIKNSYVTHDGVITNYNNWSRTNYIDVSALSEIIPMSTVISSYNAFYDENKNFISSFFTNTTSIRISVPANARYAIFSNSNAGMSNLWIGYSRKFEHQTELVKNTFAGGYCETDIDSKLLEYGDLFSASGKADTFLFFTDPHPFYGTNVETSGWLDGVMSRMPLVQKAYNSTPTSFCVCGGDWLSDNDTPAQASAKLGYVTGMMKHLFDRSYMVIGNHDTNYQGTEQLSTDALINVMFNEIGRMYYTFTNPNSRWYVFDTGTDWSHQMTPYRWEQIDWFASQLIENDDAHSVLALHIITNQYEADFDANPVFHEMAQNITAVAQAYNNKTSITLNSKIYDFSSTTGIVEFAIAGHSHYDKLTSLNNIPIMITDWLRDGDSATFDLVLADYTNHVVKTVRIGSGANRTMNMASAT